MRIILLIILCAWAFCMQAQTRELEEKFLNDAVAAKKWTLEEMQERGKMWKQVKDKYPEFPYDTAQKKLRTRYVITYPGISKADAFRRVKEWGALRFKNLDAVIEYEDLESGKIILEGWQTVWYEVAVEGYWGRLRNVPEQRQLLFSMVFTIKDGVAKIEYENLQYRYVLADYVTPLNVYVPARNYTFPVEQAFPLVSSPPISWEGAIDIMVKTVESLNAVAPDVQAYIRRLGEDYRF